jgi:hypothetical protein
MARGPRTTVLTSDIRDVMRRPASAWDYAEALPPELTGRAGAVQRSASADAVPVAQIALQSAPQRAAAPAPAPAFARQMAAAGSPGIAATSKIVQAPGSAVSAARTPATVSKVRLVAVVAVPAANVQSASKTGVEATEVESGGVEAGGVEAAAGIARSARHPAVALLDGAVTDPPQIPAGTPRGTRLVLASHDRRNLPTRFAALIPAKAAPAHRKPRHHELLSARHETATSLALASVPETPKTITAVPADPRVRTASFGPGGSGGTGLLADAAPTGSGTQSLRERIPRPEF